MFEYFISLLIETKSYLRTNILGIRLFFIFPQYFTPWIITESKVQLISSSMSKLTTSTVVSYLRIMYCKLMMRIRFPMLMIAKISYHFRVVGPFTPHVLSVVTLLNYYVLFLGKLEITIYKWDISIQYINANID